MKRYSLFSGRSIWILSDVDVTLRFFKVELSRSLQRFGNMVRMKLMHSSTLYGLPLPSPNLEVMFHIRWRTSKLVSVIFFPNLLLVRKPVFPPGSNLNHKLKQVVRLDTHTMISLFCYMACLFTQYPCAFI